MSAVSVALDVTAIPPRPAGAGRYVLELVRALAAREDCELEVFARRDDGERWRGLAPRAQVHALAPSSRPARLGYGELALAPAISRQAPRAQVLHAPHYTMPRHARIPVLVTIHDLTFVQHPEWHERSKVLVFRRALARAAKRAQACCCVSAATAAAFVETYHPSASVEVVGHGVDHQRFAPVEPEPGGDAAVLARRRVEPPYVLVLGTIEPRKDPVSLLSAFERIAASRPELSLVFAGQSGWHLEAFEARLSRSPVRSRVLRLGYVDDEEVPALLRSAAAVAYVALEEGFGLPALEALACGTALITTKRSVMAELSGDAALLVEAHDPVALAEALDEALEPSTAASDRRRRGLELARRHTWAGAAEAYLALYRRLAR